MEMSIEKKKLQLMESWKASVVSSIPGMYTTYANYSTKRLEGSIDKNYSKRRPFKNTEKFAGPCATARLWFR